MRNGQRARVQGTLLPTNVPFRVATSSSRRGNAVALPVPRSCRRRTPSIVFTFGAFGALFPGRSPLSWLCTHHRTYFRRFRCFFVPRRREPSESLGRRIKTEKGGVAGLVARSREVDCEVKAAKGEEGECRPRRPAGEPACGAALIDPDRSLLRSDSL